MLVVYEGNGPIPLLKHQTQTTLPIPQVQYRPESPVYCINDCTRESDCSRDVPYCYDADTSNSSLDLSQDQEEVNRDSHHRGFGEAAARGANSVPFYPISEDTTMFLDSLPSDLHQHSPNSSSWTVYSNSSSDEYSSHFNGGNSSNEDMSDIDVAVPSKSGCCNTFKTLDMEDDESQMSIGLAHTSISKRIRVREPRQLMGIKNTKTVVSAAVDVRLIDFAHTSFLMKGDVPTSSTTIHHGPDGGFLTGLDSLKRLLQEILDES